MTGDGTPTVIEAWTGDPEDLDELYTELRGMPGISVEVVSAPVQPGEQGAAFEMLMVALSSGAITAFLQIVKVLADSHGPKFSLKIRCGKNRLEVTGRNLDEVLPVIRKLIEDKS
jgi:Effector Associated Constant Component 1